MRPAFLYDEYIRQIGARLLPRPFVFSLYYTISELRLSNSCIAMQVSFGGK